MKKKKHSQYRHRRKNSVEESLKKEKEEKNNFFSEEANILIISNEISTGFYAQTKPARKFIKLQCWMTEEAYQNFNGFWAFGKTKNK